MITATSQSKLPWIWHINGAATLAAHRGQSELDTTREDQTSIDIDIITVGMVYCLALY
jgi:hypothetical protein